MRRRSAREWISLFEMWQSHSIDGVIPTMTELNRAVLGEAIVARLGAERNRLAECWGASSPINHFILDDLLPEPWVREIYRAFPAPHRMTLKRTLREVKYVAAQMNKYDRLLEECVYAFQIPGVVRLVAEITGLRKLEPDELLYAGGISLMTRGHFLNPHIDNSHDKFRERYRVLNLLYYVTPDWKAENGCDLELWPSGPTGGQIKIASRFNRLVVMVTHRGSWHSVSRNRCDFSRCCVSNYYFSTEPVGGREYFHVTSFRGRPEQRMRDILLRADIRLRLMIRRFFPLGIKENRHFYDKQ